VQGPQKHGRDKRAAIIPCDEWAILIFFIHLNKFYILNCPVFNSLLKVRLQNFIHLYTMEKEEAFVGIGYQGN
jgi:hypothetical protein